MKKTTIFLWALLCIVKSFAQKEADFRYKIFSDKVDYSRNTFQKETDFDHITFEKEAGFLNATFQNATFFNNDTFQDIAYFEFAIFKDYVNYCNTAFQKTAVFFNSIFDKQVVFIGTIFQKQAYFFNSSFQKQAVFFKSTFQNKALFYNAIFQKQAVFSYAIFDSIVDFKNVVFDSIADFSYTKFSRNIYFKNIITTSTTSFNFDSTSLPDTLDFSDNPHLACDIDLMTANFNDPSRIDPVTKNYKQNRRHLIFLHNTDISKFHLDYFRFKLLLIDPNTYKLPSTDEVKTIYEGLLKNFKDRGQNDSHDLLDIEYHDYLFGKWKLIRWWNCYGYHKEWVFYWAGLFILIFTILTSFFFNKFNKKDEGVYYISKIPDSVELDSIKNFFRLLWYSFMYTSTIFFMLTLKVENVNFKKAGVIYLILVYTCGILCLGYMANFVLQK